MSYIILIIQLLNVILIGYAIYLNRVSGKRLRNEIRETIKGYADLRKRLDDYINKG